MYISRSEPYCPKRGRGHSSLESGPFSARKSPVFGPKIGPKSTRDSACGSFSHDPKIGLNCVGIVKKWAFIDRSPTQNRASGGPSGSSRTSFRVLMYAACPLGRLPRFLPRLMKSEVKTVIARFLEPSSAPGFRAWKQTKRGRANRRGSLGQRHIGKSRNSLTCANENRIWRDFEVENRRILSLSWTTPEARSTIPHASPEECLDGTPGKRKAGSLDSEGRILGRGVYRKTDLMQDWKDIEQERGIATAALSSDMPAVKHRNRLVACIAVIFVAAALLFAMPSLAYASSEASASPQGGEAQEILLQQQRSSKSVDITPNQPDIAPPTLHGYRCLHDDLG